MNEFATTDNTYDRVVSLEMFEHMRNYAALFEKISMWLKPTGLFFMHIFCHRHCVYAYEGTYLFTCFGFGWAAMSDARVVDVGLVLQGRHQEAHSTDRYRFNYRERSVRLDDDTLLRWWDNAKCRPASAFS